MAKRTQTPQLSDGTTTVRLADVRSRVKVDHAHQPRSGFKSRHIRYLKQVLEDQRRFADPLEGVLDAVTGLIYLFHGFHRWTAANSGGHFYDALIRLHMPREGRTAEREAFLRSLDSPSAGFGATPETIADRRRRVKLALEDAELCALPNSELKRYLGLSADTIQYYRKQFGMLAPSDETSPAHVDDTPKRLQRALDVSYVPVGTNGAIPVA